MNADTLSWITAIISVAGTLLNNYKNYFGMVLWIISNVMWIYFFTFVQVNHSLVFMYGTFSLLNLHGILKWKTQKK